MVAAPALAAPAGAAAGAPQAGALPAVAAAARGVTVEITQRPERFVAGAEPEVVTVVASKRGGGGCLKVRWSTLLEVEGLSLEQVRVDRVEEDGSFPIDVETDGSIARITDERLDPGTLCRGRTVTARYEINVARDVRDGRIVLLAEAYDADLRLLERAGATITVAGDAAEPADEATEAAEPAPDAGGAAGGAEPPGQVDEAAAAGDDQGIPLAWFLLGGLMVFLGLSLLLNVRWRQREEEEIDQAPVGRRLANYRTVPRRARQW